METNYKAETFDLIKKSKGKYLWDCLNNRLYIPFKITNTGVKDGFVRSKGFKTHIDALAYDIENGQLKIIDELPTKKAVLVSVTFTTRLVVYDNTTESEIIGRALPRFSEKLVTELEENCTITDDTECPYEVGEMNV